MFRSHLESPSPFGAGHVASVPGPVIRDLSQGGPVAVGAPSDQSLPIQDAMQLRSAPTLPAGVQGLGDPVPKIFGMTNTQLIVLIAAAMITYWAMRRRR